MSKLIFGGWGLGGSDENNPSYENITEKKAMDLLYSIYSNGVRCIDTSPAYGNGESERRVGNFISKIGNDRSNIEIVTKVGFTKNFNKIKLNEEEIKKSLDNSINRLKTDYVDILLIHSPSEEVIKNEYVSIKNIMESLKVKKKIKEWGISLRSPKDLKYIDINNYPKYIQLNFKLLDQRVYDEINFEILASKGENFHARTVFFFGFLPDPRLYKKKLESNDHRSKINREMAFNYCKASRYMLRPIKTNNKLMRDEIALAYIKNEKKFKGILLGSLKINEWERNIKIFNYIDLDYQSVEVYQNRYKKIMDLLKK